MIDILAARGVGESRSKYTTYHAPFIYRRESYPKNRKLYRMQPYDRIQYAAYV